MAEVSAAASSGNLGPGFDMVGLALELRCRVVAEPAADWSISQIGIHRPTDVETDAVLVAAQAVVGESFPLTLTVDNDIPLARGLGSSSAARAAGAAAALKARDGSFNLDEVYQLVREFEGHGDNAAAAVYGGLMAIGPGGEPMALPMHPDWRVIVAVPEYALATSKARAALLPTVSRAVVVRNSGRLTALIDGLRSGDPGRLALASGDEVHEQARAILHERAVELIAAARRGGAPHAAWSGAGPTVMAFCLADAASDVTRLMESTMAGQGDVHELAVAAVGIIG